MSASCCERIGVSRSDAIALPVDVEDPPVARVVRVSELPSIVALIETGARKFHVLPLRGVISHVALFAELGASESPPAMPEYVQWWLSADADGAIPLTPRVVSAWNASADGAGGGVAEAAEVAYVVPRGSDGVYVWAVQCDADGVKEAADAGVKLAARVVWRVLATEDYPPGMCR